jgi:valyl-tRNA synthetase
VRNARAEHQVESNKLIEARIYAGRLAEALGTYTAAIQSLAQIKSLQILDAHHQGGSDDQDLVLVLKEAEVVIPLSSMVDLAAEKVRLEKEMNEVKTNVERLEVRLNDQAFISKAPPAVVQKERNRLTEGKDKMQRLQQQLERFNSHDT